MAKFCIFCGSPLPKDAVYCGECGQRVKPYTTDDGRLVIPAPPGAEVTISDEPPAGLQEKDRN